MPGGVVHRPRPPSNSNVTDYKMFKHYLIMSRSSQSWEIGSPPTGGAGRMKLSCVVPASVIHI